MNRLRLIKTAYTALACLMLAACASDELTDGTVQDLPEGKYPLQISSVTMSAESTAKPWAANAPQSRVSENTNGNSSEWNEGDEITVQLSGKMADNSSYTAEGNYKLNSDRKTLSSVSGKELYWHSTSEGTVTAWYCNPAAASDNTVNLSDQSNGLAYVLKAAEVSNVVYNTSPSLSFSHQLAKVRVKLTGTNASAATSVSVKGNTKCTVTQGVVSSSGIEGYISMRKPVTGGEYWEANVVPGTIDKADFLQVNGTAVNVETTLTKLDAAKYYNFEVKVEKKQTEAKQNEDGSYTINAGDNVYITGTVTGTITINGTADVELKDVTSNNKTPIKITNGSTPVIKITGTNTFTTKDGTPGIHLDGSNANVEITGDGTDKSSLTITVPDATALNQGSPAIGSYGEYNHCGNIKISNITLTASGNKNRGGDYSAAIGTGAGFSAECGDIIIENCIIVASAQENAAAIGFGKVYDGGTIKSITITNSQLNLTVTGEGAGIGFGSNNDNTSQSIGPIIITSNENESTFFANDRFNVQGYKVGKSSNYYSNQSWVGVTFNGKILASGSSNGY